MLAEHLWYCSLKPLDFRVSGKDGDDRVPALSNAPCSETADHGYGQGVPWSLSLWISCQVECLNYYTEMVLKPLLLEASNAMKCTNVLTTNNFHIFNKGGPMWSNIWTAWFNLLCVFKGLIWCLQFRLFSYGIWEAIEDPATVPALEAQMRFHCNYNNSKIVTLRRQVGDAHWLVQNSMGWWNSAVNTDPKDLDVCLHGPGNGCI